MAKILIEGEQNYLKKAFQTIINSCWWMCESHVYIVYVNIYLSFVRNIYKTYKYKFTYDILIRTT